MWYVSRYVNGRRLRRAGGPRRADAARLLAQLEAVAVVAQEQQPEAPAALVSTSLGELLEAYRRSLAALTLGFGSESLGA